MLTRLIGIFIILVSFFFGMIFALAIVDKNQPVAVKQIVSPSPIASASATPKILLSPTVRPSVTPVKSLSLPKATLAPKR